MYSLEVRESVDRIFSKLARKNPKQMQIIDKKIKQVLKSPNHFKPLRAPMQHLRRVHIDKSFVLTYSVGWNSMLFDTVSRVNLDKE